MDRQLHCDRRVAKINTASARVVSLPEPDDVGLMWVIFKECTLAIRTVAALLLHVALDYQCDSLT